MKINHYSFDLWFTLIKSDPNFKLERSNLFYKNYNSKNKSKDQIIAIFRDVDLMCNAINEKTEKNIQAEEMYLMVLYLINDSSDIFNHIDINKLYTEIEDLLFKYPPKLFDTNTFSTLRKINNEGKSMNILSNTAFIKGKTLRRLMNELGIGAFFGFQIYSDEIGLSKPSIDLFRMMHFKAEEINSNTLPMESIIHIGDNIVSDINGANNYGINSFQINTNSFTIINLINND